MRHIPVVPGSSDTLQAGFHQKDITPRNPIGVNLAGFGPNRLSTGVRDPLYARATTLSRGGDSVTLCVLDAIGMMYPWVQRILDRLPPDVAAGTVITSTHSHSSPDTMGLWGDSFAGILPTSSGMDPAHLHYLTEQAAAAIMASRENLTPVRASLHHAQIPYPNIIENIREPGNFDRRLSAIQLRTVADDRLFGVLVHFGCHPEILWECNTRLSGDFVGDLCTAVSGSSGAFCQFVNGALGGMVTGDIAMHVGDREREAFIAGFVRQLRDLIQHAMDRDGMPLTGPTTVLRQPLHVEVANWKFRLAERMGVLDRDFGPKGVATEVALINLAGLRCVTLPGEPLPAVGYETASRLGDPNGLVVGLGMDELGYLLPQSHFGRWRYRYESSMSPGAATVPRLMQAVMGLVSVAGD